MHTSSIPSPSTPFESRFSKSDLRAVPTSCCSQPTGLDPADVADIETLSLSLGNGTIYASPMWQRCWWRHFTPQAARLFIHRLHAGNKLVAAIPLIHRGRLMRTWTAPRNSNSLIVDLVSDAASPQAWRVFLESFARSAHVLEIGPLQAASPPSLALIGAAKRLNLKHTATPTTPMALLDLSIGWKTYRSHLSRNLLGNTERVQRRLAAMGTVTFQEHQGGPEIPSLLTECFELEARTWKGAEHSAILSNPATLGFYTDLSLEAAAGGALSLYTLRLDGRLIAFDLCLRRGPWLHDLKFSYEPDMARYAPCNALRYLLLKREMEEAPRARWYDLGMQCEWKTRWTNSAPLEVLRVYSESLPARMAWLAGPVLRGRLKRVRALRRGVESLRQLRSRARNLRRAAIKRSLNEPHADTSAIRETTERS